MTRSDDSTSQDTRRFGGFSAAVAATCLLVLAAPAPSLAQTGERGPVTDRAPMERPRPELAADSVILSGLLDYMDRKGGYIVAALEQMPADSFDFEATAGQRTFRQQAAHVVGSNFGVCSVLADDERPDPGVNHQSSKDALVEAMKRSFAYCGQVLGEQSDRALKGTVEMRNGETMKASRLAFFLAGNWADHYGHFATHLRMNGMTPPSETRKKQGEE